MKLYTNTDTDGRSLPGGKPMSRRSSLEPPANRVGVPHGVIGIEPVPNMEVRSFPRDDEEFRADVEAAIVAARRQLHRVMVHVDEVQLKLRPRYPLVALHAQSALAMFPGQHPAIYAYRDGRVIAVATARNFERSPRSAPSAHPGPEPVDELHRSTVPSVRYRY